MTRDARKSSQSSGVAYGGREGFAAARSRRLRLGCSRQVTQPARDLAPRNCGRHRWGLRGLRGCASQASTQPGHPASQGGRATGCRVWTCRSCRRLRRCWRAGRPAADPRAYSSSPSRCSHDRVQRGDEFQLGRCRRTPCCQRTTKRSVTQPGQQTAACPAASQLAVLRQVGPWLTSRSQRLAVVKALTWENRKAHQGRQFGRLPISAGHP
jgi:hypothetical protein